MQKRHRGHGSLFQTGKQRGFGLVAAMFLIIVIAGAIAAMWHLSSTQAITGNRSVQQARAYQAARAGIEWGISRALSGSCSEINPPFAPDGFSKLFQVDVSCSKGTGAPDLPVDLPEEGIQNIVFYTITSRAEYSSVGSADYAYRKLQAVIEQHSGAEQSGETEKD